MRSVLIATDFIYRENGTLVPTEINTDSSHSLPLKVKGFGADSFLSNFGDYFEHQEFNQFLINNGFNKIVTIDKSSGSHRIFESFCAYYNIQYQYFEVTKNSITIPEVVDDSTTLIIRIAYDTYSLVDDLYARDMYEFHNLIKNEPFASPVSFTTENLDTINTFEPSQDGVIPNYVIKPRLPGYPKYEYPKLFRLDSSSELDALKGSISNNEFVQKYEYNSTKLIQNRTSFIRGMDLIYGPNLDTIHILSYKLPNTVSTQNGLLRYEKDIDLTTKKLDPLFSTKWWPSQIVESGLLYHFDGDDEIVLSDGSLIKGSDITTENIVRTIEFTNDITFGNIGNVSDLESHTIGDSPIVSKTPPNMRGVFVNLTAKDSEGKIYKWFDGMSNIYLISKSGSDLVQYRSIGASVIEIGDIIYTLKMETSTIESLEVLEIYYDLKPGLELYTISLESEFQFLVKFNSEDTETPKILYLIQHNQICNELCGAGYDCLTSNGYFCGLCGKGSPGCPNCGGYSGYICNSDLRYKKNINKIGQSVLGINVYNFEYINEPGVVYQGVIAQELIGTKHEAALSIDENEYYSVDYSKIDVDFLKIN